MREQLLSLKNPPAEKPFPWRCPKCRQPTVSRVTLPYSCQRTLDGRVVTVEVSNLAVPRCSNCGEMVFDYAADEQIRAALQTQIGSAMNWQEDATTAQHGTPLSSNRFGVGGRAGYIIGQLDETPRTEEELIRLAQAKTLQDLRNPDDSLSRDATDATVECLVLRRLAEEGKIIREIGRDGRCRYCLRKEMV